MAILCPQCLILHKGRLVTLHHLMAAGHRLMSGDNSSISMGLSALSQPLKLNLVRAPHEEQLRNYSGHTVLIEPLASMAAVEYFLWPRVQRSAGEAAREEAAKTSRAAAEEVCDLLLNVDPRTYSMALTPCA